MSILQELLKYKIVAIIRGAQPDAITNIAAALYAGGVRAMEITLNSPGAIEAIAMLRKQNDMLIGAGTVLTKDEVKAVTEAGAQFIISPGTDAEVIQFTKKQGLLSMPGAFTPTEIVTAYQAGADIVKFFPAGDHLSFFKDLQGPLAHIPLMPTGSITLGNIVAFQQAGAKAFGIGSALVNTKETMKDTYFEQLQLTAEKFVQAVQ